MSNNVKHFYEFDEFRLDAETPSLWRDGKLVPIFPKALEILVLLVGRNGAIVSREELLETVWHNTFVEESNITYTVSLLRKTLDEHDKKHFIQTIPKRGYRFAADVREVTENGLPVIEDKVRLAYRTAVPIRFVQASNGNSHSLDTNGKEILQVTPTEEFVVEAMPKLLPAKKTRSWKKLGVAVGFLLLALVGFFGYRFLRPRIASFFRTPIGNVSFQKLTNTGDLLNAALSPDGNFLAFIKNDRIYLKDIASGKDIALEISGATSFSAVQFSADGNFLYFRNKQMLLGHGDVFRVSRFGGETKLVVAQISGDFGLSADGKYIAFVRSFPADPKPLKLIVKHLETGAEREIYAAEALNPFSTSPPAFSPDGKKIAFLLMMIPPNNPRIVDVESGAVEELKITGLRRFEYVAWHTDGKSLIVSADTRVNLPQLWKVFYPEGDYQQLTNGLSSFTKVSLSADGKKIFALQTDEFSNIYTANAANLNEQKQLTFGNANREGQATLVWLDDDRIVYPSQIEGNVQSDLWLMNSNDGARQQLTENKDFTATMPDSDGKAIYFQANRPRFFNIFRMDAGGGNVTAMTEGNDGLRQFPNASPDGKYLYYLFRGREKSHIKRMNLADGKEEIFFQSDDVQPVLFLTLSADGKHLAFPVWRNPADVASIEKGYRVAVISTENPADIKTLEGKLLVPMLRLTPDGKAVEYISDAKEGTQILRQNFDGGEPNTILILPKEKIFNFAWSKSGTRLAISRGQSYKDAVMLTNFD